MKTQPFPSFKRGVTDYPVDAQNYAKRLDNVLLDTAGKPYQRAGQTPWFASGSNQNLAGTRIAGFYKYWVSGNTYDLILFTQNRAYYYVHNMGSVGVVPPSPSWSEVLDTSSNPFFPNGNANTRFSPWLWASNHIFVATDPDISLANFGVTASAPRPMVVYPAVGGALTVRGVGLPTYGSAWATSYKGTVAAGQCAAGSTNTVQDGAQSSGTNYVYQFYWSYTYTDVNGTVHLVVGPVTQVVINSNAATTSGPQVKFTSLPWFTAVAADHMDPTQWTLNIARQGQSDQVFHVIQTYTYSAWNALSPKSFTDAWRDADGWFGKPNSFYNGTFSATGNPPQGQYGGVVSDTAYYLFGSTLYQAWPGTIDVWPPSFTLNFEEPARGFGELDYPIVFLQTKTYRVEGVIDSAGNGNMVKRVVSADKGCLSAQSIVRVGRQLFWAANDGFYTTDGWTARKISGHLDRSYSYLTKDFTGALSIKGEYIPHENRIYWVMRDPASSSGDNEIVWVLDLNHGLDPTGCFTTWSGGLNVGGWTATAFIAGPGKTLIRGDKGGYVWSHTDGQIDDRFPNSLFFNVPVYPVVRTWVFTADHPAKTKWSSKVFATMRQRGYGSNGSQRHQIAKERDETGVWKSGSPVGSTTLQSGSGANHLFKYKSFLARGSSRYNAISLQVSKAWMNIAKSDSFCAANVSGGTVVTPTVTNGFASIPNLGDLQGGRVSIAFANDGYVTEYKVNFATAAQITLTPGTVAPTLSATKWVIRGVPFNEDFYYENLELSVELFDESNVLGSSYAQENLNT